MVQILLIDDDKEKCSEIISLLSEVGSVKIDISHNIYDGKEKLFGKYYDLLILDMNLPYSDEEECSEEAGFLLYREIQKVKTLKKPGDIVILTAFEELQDRYNVDISKGLFTIVKYSAVEQQWREQIKNKVQYMLKSTDDAIDPSSNGYKYDLAIITAVQIEFDQMKRFITESSLIQIKSDPTFYLSGFIVNGEIKKSVILAMQHQMGMTAASVLTTKIINNFKPRYVSMVGIAAGKRGEGNFGDIIIPTEVWDYGSGKIAAKEEGEEGETANYLFRPDPKYISLEVEMKEIVNKDYSEMLQRIRDSWVAPKPESVLKVIKGPLACGSVVVQNEDVIKRFIDPHNRKLKGLDMESYGVFYAVENSYRPKPKVIVCKSICDFGDKEKNDNYQDYAAYTSAAFLNYLALNELN
jgi:nucleoside phosphorylase